VPREPAYAAKRSQDGGVPAASEREDATMASSNVRRRGMGSPEPTESAGGYFFGGAYAGGSVSPRFSTAARVVISTHSSPSCSFTM